MGPKTPEHGAPDLRAYLKMAARRKWSILLIVCAAVGASIYFSTTTTPTYTSSARVLVKNSGLASTTPVGEFVNLQTEREIATSESVAEIAAERLDGGASAENISAGLSTEVVPETEILVLSYSHLNPHIARERAQAFAEAYLQQRRQALMQDLLASSESIQVQMDEVEAEIEAINRQLLAAESEAEEAPLRAQASALASRLGLLQSQLADLTPPENLRVGEIVAPAHFPGTPATPYMRNGLFALFAGLALGFGVAFLRDRLDDRVRSTSDLEVHGGTPVMAVIPHVESWKKNGSGSLISLAQSQTPPAEAYRNLRTGLIFSATQKPIQTVLVTSAESGEGKSVTAANLGVALARAGKRVVMVSADLRRPTIHKPFGIDNRVGLTSVLSGAVPLDVALIPVHGLPNLLILTSGRIPGNPSELLLLPEMGEIMSKLRAKSDFVLLDAPPVLPVSDPLILSGMADAVIFVTDASTPKSSIEHATDRLRQVDAPIVGSVLNNLDPKRSSYSGPAYNYQYLAKE